MGLISRIKELEKQVETLTTKLNELINNTQEGVTKPYSKTGINTNSSRNQNVDFWTGLGAVSGNPIVWNDSELATPPAGHKPDTPHEGYNKHSHSRYSGGALDVHTLELIEYDVALKTTAEEDEIRLYEWDSSDYNKHCQGFWMGKGPKGEGPAIKQAQTSGGHDVSCLGPLNVKFNADIKAWEFIIDIKNTKFVQYDWNESTGLYEIAKDSKDQEKSAPLWNVDATKTNIVWDENGKCWRLFAVYADA